jgi:hypothetical protein
MRYLRLVMYKCEPMRHVANTCFASLLLNKRLAGSADIHSMSPDGAKRNTPVEPLDKGRTLGGSKTILSHAKQI